ncbi:hypothetical protein TKK_0008479 [Trichogramma kaykai]
MSHTFNLWMRRYKNERVLKYLEKVKDSVSLERSTLEVSFEDIEKYNQALSTTLIDWVNPFLYQTVTNYVKNQAGPPNSKDYFLSLVGTKLELSLLLSSCTYLPCSSRASVRNFLVS